MSENTRAELILGAARACTHEYVTGLCRLCGCPERAGDTERAVRALDAGQAVACPACGREVDAEELRRPRYMEAGRLTTGDEAWCRYCRLAVAPRQD